MTLRSITAKAAAAAAAEGRRAERGGNSFALDDGDDDEIRKFRALIGGGVWRSTVVGRLSGRISFGFELGRSSS